VSHLDRYREIAETLARHGLEVLIGASGVERWVPFHRVLVRRVHRGPTYSTAEHLRLALEELGPTFVKLGQLLSTRPDLLPPAYLLELAKLQDALLPVSAEVIVDLVTQELGGRPDEVFATFDLVPLASASIGQAHAATLHDGTDVVVKVRRPGSVERIDEDLEILQNFAAQANRRWKEAADYDLAGLAEEFARTLRAELDYLAEGRNAERFAENFTDNPGVHIPKVYWETTTTRILTLERIRGLKVSDLDALDAAGIDRPALAARAAEVAAQMIFDDGFFHADPHPGNLFIEGDGRIGLIDFGMVGSVDAELRERLGVLLVALARKDPHRIASALSRLSTAQGQVNLTLLAADMMPVIAMYDGKALREVPVGKLIREVLAVMRRRHLQLPREVSLLLKMVVMTEGMGVSLDPDFQLGSVIGPYAQRLVANRYSPTQVAHHLAEAGVDAMELMTQLPIQLRRLQAMLDAGGPEVHITSAELEPLMGRVETMVQRIVFGVVAAAFVRGVGELVAADPERRKAWQGPLLGAGVGTAGSLAAYLGWTSRKRR
jgi:ubiquinone biosynthesis protein